MRSQRRAARFEKASVMIRPEIKRIIARFAETIQGVNLVLTHSLPALEIAAAAGENQIDRFIADNLEISGQDNEICYRFTAEHASSGNGVPSSIGRYRTFFAARKKLEKIRLSSRSLPVSLFIQMGTLYDAYLVSLAKLFLSISEDKVSGPDLTSAQIAQSAALGSSQKDIVEREADSLLLMSPEAQFTWLENKFNVELRSDLSSSAPFVEVMERHGLYLRNDGIVSLQYLDTCARSGVQLNDAKPGDRLDITPAYCAAAYETIYQTGVELGHILWRKIIPEEVSKANAALQGLAFSLIQSQDIKLAANLLAFANTTLRQYSDDNNRLVFLINGALASYLCGDKSESAKMLGSEDWSAKPDIFKLPYLVLTEQFEEAAQLMRTIGKDGRPNKAEYLRWPLFEEFRKTQEFTSAFSDLFGEVTLPENEVRALRKLPA